MRSFSMTKNTRFEVQVIQSGIIARNLAAWRKAKQLREYNARAWAIRRGASLLNIGEAIALKAKLL